MKDESMKALVQQMVKSAKEYVRVTNALNDKYGIQICEGFRIKVGTKSKVQIHVHRGIDDIIEEMGLSSHEEKEAYARLPYKYTEISGADLFQPATENGYIYIRAREKR